MLFLLSLTTFSISLTDVSQRIIAGGIILASALLYRLYMQPAVPVVAYWTALVSKLSMPQLIACDNLLENNLKCIQHLQALGFSAFPETTVYTDHADIG